MPANPVTEKRDLMYVFGLPNPAQLLVRVAIAGEVQVSADDALGTRVNVTLEPSDPKGPAKVYNLLDYAPISGWRTSPSLLKAVTHGWLHVDIEDLPNQQAEPLRQDQLINGNLTVNGVVHSTTGGFQFPDGTIQITAGGGSVITAVLPLSGTGTSGDPLTIQQAGSTQNGYLSSADWVLFNSKENALTFTAPLTRVVNTVSIPAATGSVDGYVTTTTQTFGGNKTIAGSLTVATGGANTAAILTLGNTAGDVQVFRTDATPQSSVTGSVGDLAVDGTAGRLYIKVSGSATNTGWSEVGSTFSTPPGGSETHIQFHDAGGVFGGDAGLTYNKTTDTVSLVNLVITGSVTGHTVPSVDLTYDLGSASFNWRRLYVGEVTATTYGAPGSDTQVLFNDGGVIAGDGGLVFDKTSNVVTVSGALHTGTIRTNSTTGNMGVAGGTASLPGAFYNVTGTAYAASPGAASAEFIIGQYATSSFYLTSYNAALINGWTSHLQLKGASGHIYIGPNDGTPAGETVPGGTGFVGVGVSRDIIPSSKLHVHSKAATTSAILTLENTSANIQHFVTTATPESAVTGSIGDLAVDAAGGSLWLKTSGSATNTGWSQMATQAFAQTAPGSDSQIIYNNGGVYGADAAFTFNDSVKVVTMAGDVTISGSGTNAATSVNIGTPGTQSFQHSAFNFGTAATSFWHWTARGNAYTTVADRNNLILMWSPNGSSFTERLRFDNDGETTFQNATTRVLNHLAVTNPISGGEVDPIAIYGATTNTSLAARWQGVNADITQTSATAGNMGGWNWRNNAGNIVASITGRYVTHAANTPTGDLLFTVYNGNFTPIDGLYMHRDGRTNVGTTTLIAESKFRVYEAGASTAPVWRGRGLFGGDSKTVVLGERNNQAWIAAHSGDASAWADLYIQPGGAFKTYIGDVTGGGDGASPILTVDNATGRVGAGAGTATLNSRLHVVTAYKGDGIFIYPSSATNTPELRLYAADGATVVTRFVAVTQANDGAAGTVAGDAILQGVGSTSKLIFGAGAEASNGIIRGYVNNTGWVFNPLSRSDTDFTVNGTVSAMIFADASTGLTTFASGAARTSPILEIENTAGDVQVFIGSGTPEGAVTGSIGDHYTDLLTGTEYRKTTGSATNTGWSALATAAGAATAPGSDTQVIYNNGGVYGADAGLTYDDVGNILTAAGGLLAPGGNVEAGVDVIADGFIGAGVTPAVPFHAKLAAGPTLRLERDDADVVVGDNFGTIEFYGNDASVGAGVRASIRGVVEGTSSTAWTGIRFGVTDAGAHFDAMLLGHQGWLSVGDDLDTDPNSVLTARTDVNTTRITSVTGEGIARFVNTTDDEGVFIDHNTIQALTGVSATRAGNELRVNPYGDVNIRAGTVRIDVDRFGVRGVAETGAAAAYSYLRGAQTVSDTGGFQNIIKLHSHGINPVAGAAAAMLFQVGAETDRAKGMLAYELESGTTWGRGRIAFYNNNDGDGTVVGASDAVLGLPNDMGAPAVGEIMQAVSTNGNVNWKTPAEAMVDAWSTSWGIWEDFVGGLPTTTGDGPLTLTTSGTGATVDYGLGSAPGIAALKTGTTSTGKAALVSGGSTFEDIGFGTHTTVFEARVNIPLAQDPAVDEFTVRAGFTGAGHDGTHSAMFYFDQVNTDWRYECANGSTGGSESGGTGVTADSSWAKLRIVATSTSVQFYIDGNLEATVTGVEIPTDPMFYFVDIEKSLGTSSRTLNVDYLGVYQSGLSR